MQTLLFGDRYDHYVPVSLATPLLGLRVRIPRGEMIVSSEFGMGLCVGLITRPEESYRVCVCVCVPEGDREASIMRRPWHTGSCCTMEK